jgi:molybdopterin molybdotransferase
VRSAVDGYALRSADTAAAGPDAPLRLRVTGSVRMGEVAGVAVGAGEAVAVPTGGSVPDGADSVVMHEHVLAEDGEIVITRPAQQRGNVVSRDEDVASGAVLVVPGQTITPQTVGLLAAAGVAALEVHARPLVSVVATGDEIVGPPAQPQPGQVRDANTPALSAAIAELGGEPFALGIVGDDPAALERVCRRALGESDMLMVSAGSSVGARDATAGVVAALGEPGVWCHGLAVRPGKPTLLADVGGKPVIGLPGNPLSALVVLRLIGVDLLARIGGHAKPPPRARVAAVLGREVRSSAGRRDIVQVVLDGAVATPQAATASMLSAMSRADGWIEVDEDTELLPEGSQVEVRPYRH